MNYSFIFHIMYLPLSKYHFDTMFVILCVIARAISQSISDTSKTSINQLNNHYRASFMDFILDANLIELLQSSNLINKDLAYSYSSSHKSIITSNQHSHNICARLSNILSSNNMKFCHNHLDVLETIIFDVLQLTKFECKRITGDLRWNCPSIEHFLDRTNNLAFTKEAALVRSILNASMMYLVVKTCIESNYLSCGCLEKNRILLTNTFKQSTNSPKSTNEDEHNGLNNLHNNSVMINQENLSVNDLSKLDAGSPVRLNKSTQQRQGCLANIGFANAFTKVFIDSDDNKALSKTYRVLNEDYNSNKLNTKPYIRRLVDSDYKDLAFIKWTKASINIHNNNVGRQMVRDAIQKRCRCHGLSGGCQYQTCWDQLRDFDTITSKLKHMYLANSIKAQVENLGTFEKPDLYLFRSHSSLEKKAPIRDNTIETLKKLTSWKELDSLTNSSTINNFLLGTKSVTPQELLYLNESPDYCDAQPAINFIGTKGRACALMNNVTEHSNVTKKNFKNAELLEKAKYVNYRSPNGVPGPCQQLCCNRGYHSELVLDMVPCNCRFKFCCKVECEHCLRQRLQHFCL